MVVNQASLLSQKPIVNMLETKQKMFGVSFGLSEAGYDIRIKQSIIFSKPDHVLVSWDDEDGKHFTENQKGNFAIASAIEEFSMPDNLMGIVHDKSTWARKGLSVFNTVIEPGWKGFLTLELVYFGNDTLIIPAGSGIAQVVFHQTTDNISYNGKYQNQANKPVSAIHE